ncbi:MAG: hypothetical protein U1E52_04310 [Geminicoccaceae bacterium]
MSVANDAEGIAELARGSGRTPGRDGGFPATSAWRTGCSPTAQGGVVNGCACAVAKASGLLAKTDRLDAR